MSINICAIQGYSYIHIAFCSIFFVCSKLSWGITLYLTVVSGCFKKKNPEITSSYHYMEMLLIINKEGDKYYLKKKKKCKVSLNKIRLLADSLLFIF